MIITHKYMIVPINRQMTVKRVFFISEGKSIFDFDAQLDFKTPEFYLYLNVERFRGMDILFSVHPQIDFSFTFSDEKSPLPSGNDRYRPFVHFTSRYGWLNDPNGMIFYNGEYHVFYQHNPAGVSWGNMHWGHAVSRDLMNWTELDDAVFPDEFGSAFSGSAIEDIKNVSGLKENGYNPLLLFYTAAGGDRELSAGKKFTQRMIYSVDGGKSFKRYNDTLIDHIIAENRDPKVVYVDELQMYVMALFLDGHEYALFGSADLLRWNEFQHITLPDDAECPDLFPLPVEGSAEHKWVMMGACDTYTVGNFKNGRFTPEQEYRSYYYHGIHGRTSYAAQSFSGLSDRRIRMTWENMRTPDSAFYGQLSVPCEMSLVKDAGCLRLKTLPVMEFENNRVETRIYSDVVCSTKHPFVEELSPDAYDITLTVAADTPDFTFYFFGIYYDVIVSRNVLNYCGIEAPLSFSGGDISIRVISDKLGVEIFIDGGLIYTTVDFIQDYAIDRLTVIPDSPDTEVHCQLGVSRMERLSGKR